MSRNVQKYIILILCILFITSIYLMNCYVPFFSDDLHCTYLYTKKISNISDVINVLKLDYTTCNGRIIPNLLVMLSVWAGENFFNIINTILTFIAFIFLWKSVSVNKLENKLISFLILIIGFLVLSTGIDSLYYWAAGASNYVWTLIPTLLFIMLMSKDYRCNPIILCIIGIVLALQNEMYICPLTATYWTVAVFNKKWMSRNRWILLTGFTIGMIIVVLSPGNFGRESAYTMGLGAISRIIKIMYSLRIFYVLAIITFACYLKNKNKTIDFLKDNSKYLLIIAFSFVIPFLSATASRAVYAIDIFSLILLIRLINTINIHDKILSYGICTCLTVLLIWFQSSILYASNLKWNIYKQTVQTYENHSSNTVVMNDIQCSNPLIEYYTVNINNILMPRDKSVQLALEKRRRQGQIVSEDYITDNELIKIIPQNIDVNQRESIPFVGFRNNPMMRYYIMPWKKGIVEKINSGYFYAMYKIPVINKKLKINYLSNDVSFERATYSISYKGKRYILLNKKYKHYPFIRLLYMGFNKELATNKIEMIK